MGGSEHTLGCVAATFGIAASASLFTASTFVDRMDEAAVANNMKKVCCLCFRHDRNMGHLRLKQGRIRILVYEIRDGASNAV